MNPPLPTPLLQQAYDHWNTLRGGNAMPRQSDFVPLNIPRALPNIMLIDVQREPLDFFYKTVGGVIVYHSAEPFEEQWMSDIPERRSPSTPWMNFQKVVSTGQPSRSTIPYIGPHKDFLETSQIALPLSDDRNTQDVAHLLVVIDYLRR